MASPKRKKPTKDQLKQRKKAVSDSPASSQQAFHAFRAAHPAKKIALHIGCGEYHPERLHKAFRGPEWVELRMDINPAVKPHIIADMINLAPLPDNAVDAVWSSHNLEHVYAYQLPAVLSEFYRVLKPEGVALLTMPDLQTVAGYVARGNLEEPLYQTANGPISAQDIMFGWGKMLAEGNHFMAHRNGFTAQSLGKKLRDVGFSAIKVKRETYDLWATGHKYPAGHPQYSEKILIQDNVQDRMANLPPVPPLAKTPHPGTLWPGKLSDELDMPPFVWSESGKA